MKKILFITDTYYPDSGATTTIIKRTCEALAALGYGVSVYPAEISGAHYDYPRSVNGVEILKDLPGDYDYVFSCAVNFEVNFLAHDAINGRACRWFPMSYDPYAFNPHISDEERAARYKREMEALCDAEKIFFLTEFGDDYAGSEIEDKIEYFNLPCIRPINPDREKKTVVFDDAYINCVFLGDFYTGVENTDFIFRLFEKVMAAQEAKLAPSLANRPIRLYTIGGPGDYQDTINIWKEKLGERYICLPRISQEEAHNVILDCDVLVSMGHDSANMCPSKALDFASSGKPILHICKIKNCCANRYLERYPAKHSIYQGEALAGDRVEAVREFICSATDKEPIPFDTVLDLYNDFTLESLIEKIVRALEG